MLYVSAVSVPSTVEKLILIGDALWINFEWSVFLTNKIVNSKSSPSITDTLSISTTMAMISLQSLSVVSGSSLFGKSVGTWPFVGFTNAVLLSYASSKPSLSMSIFSGVVSAIPSLSKSQASIASSRMSLSELRSI